MVEERTTDRSPLRSEVEHMQGETSARRNWHDQRNRELPPG